MTLMPLYKLRRALATGRTPIFIGLLLLLGCQAQSEELLRLTQCYRDKTLPPCEQWKRGHEFCAWFFDAFPLDRERGCYGQRWNIPKVYYDRKYVSYNPATETLVIRLGIPDLTPRASLPRARDIPLFTEVRIEPLWYGKFIEHLRRTRDIRAPGNQLEKTGRVMYGMDVYDQSQKSNTYPDVFFFPPGEAQLFVRCIVRPNSSIEEIRPDGACEVVSNINDRAYLSYHIKYSQMPELIPINDKLTGLIRSFLAN
jgi:hypothetical protein